MNEEELAALKEANPKAYDSYMALKGENDKLKAAPPPKKEDPTPENPDLATKAKKEREDTEARQKSEKSLEAALNFNIGAKDFLKNNAALLPKSIEGIFAAAEKEKYDSAIDKANDIKVGIISEFFAVQANHDHLTGPQKIEVDNFLKLTKNGKQERVENVYSMIFEPTLESVRKIEKAKQLGLGNKSQSDGEKAFADRLMKQSKQYYLGEKHNA